MTVRSKVGRKPHPPGLAVLATLLFVVLIQSASAGSTAAIDAGTAAGLCSSAYPPSSGTEPLARCQWDMASSTPAWRVTRATGEGVKVGVIDSGVDFTHPDIAADRPSSVVLVHLQRHADSRPAGDRERRLHEQGRRPGSSGPWHTRLDDDRRADQRHRHRRRGS